MVDLGRVRLFGKAMRCIKVATLRLEDAAMPMQRAFHGRLTSQSAVLPVPQTRSMRFSKFYPSVFFCTHNLRVATDAHKDPKRHKGIARALADCPTAFRSDSASEIYAA